MDDDEQAIRYLVETWVEATKSGDTATVLELIADDALFMVPGGQIFGKEAFAASSDSMRESKIDGRAEIREMHIEKDWAWIRNHIDLTVTNADSDPVRRSGYAMTVLKKGEDGRWRLFRDANLVT